MILGEVEIELTGKHLHDLPVQKMTKSNQHYR